MAINPSTEVLINEIQSLSSLGYWIWNFNNDAFHCSSETKKILRLGPEDSKPSFNGFLSRLLPEDRDIFQKTIRKTIQSGEDFVLEFNIPSYDGRALPVEIRGRVIKSDEKNADSILGVIQNIERRKKTEEDLFSYEKVFENTSEGIAITDGEGRILKVNKPYQQITGYSEDELIGRELPFYKSEKHDKDFFDGMREIIKTAGFWKGEVWDKRKNGDLFPKWLSIAGVLNQEGKIIQYVAIFSDISLMKESEEKISYLFYHNNLTGLPNTNRLHEVLLDEEKSAVRYNHRIVIIDIILDNLKTMNEIYGHGSSDGIMLHIVERLKSSVRDTDGIFQTGDNEFVILLANITHTRNVAMKAEQIIKTLTGPINIKNENFFLTCSAGIAVYPDETGDVRNLLDNASTAAGHARLKGQNEYQFYSEEMNKSISIQNKMESLMRHAVDRQEFELVYMPFVSCTTGKVAGMEALLRWNNNELGKVMPSDFIPLAEETGIITDIGEWTLFIACSQFMSAIDHFENVPLKLSLNLSTRQFRNPALAKTILDVLDYTHFKAEWLELEITENLFMGNMGIAVETIDSLRENGISIALDDFGTGYSSLAYIKNFPIDTIKIDRSFTSDLGKNSESESIVKSILSLAGGLGLNTIAEGVETEEQIEFLKNHSCDFMQGFYFGKPVPLKELMESLSLEK